MRKTLFAFAVLAFCACGSSDEKSENKSDRKIVTGTALEQRLDEYFRLTDNMEFEKLMDYIYPKLFTLAPRKQMIEGMKKTYDDGELRADLDSVRITKIYPVFTVGNGQYAKVGYSIVMLISFIHNIDKDQMDYMTLQIAEKYGLENVSLEGKQVKIRQQNYLVAVKNEYALDWSFVSYHQDDPLMEKLLNKEVVSKLATYK